MFPGVNKTRLAGAIVLCFILWKLLYYATQLQSLKYLDLNGSFFETKHKNRVLISVYYEALCSDSRNFILRQLLPVYEKAPRIVEIDLIPYGKATTIEERGTYKFECQHSYIECEANKLHACVWNTKYAKRDRLKMIGCMIDDYILPPAEVTKKCASELGMNFQLIEKCANGEQGTLLLKDYGIRTHAVTPKITFVPTVHLNNMLDVPLAYVLKDLFKEICKLFDKNLPVECL